MVHYCKSNLRFLSVTTKILLLQQKYPNIMLTLPCFCYTIKLSPNQGSILLIVYLINSLLYWMCSKKNLGSFRQYSEKRIFLGEQMPFSWELWLQKPVEGPEKGLLEVFRQGVVGWLGFFFHAVWKKKTSVEISFSAWAAILCQNFEKTHCMSLRR